MQFQAWPAKAALRRTECEPSRFDRQASRAMTRRRFPASFSIAPDASRCATRFLGRNESIGALAGNVGFPLAFRSASRLASIGLTPEARTARASAAFARACANVTSALPSPISVTRPANVNRNIHLRAPDGATASHKPPPSPCRPVFAAATALADNFPIALAMFRLTSRSYN